MSIEADILTSDMSQWPEKLLKMKSLAMLRLKMARLNRGEGTRKWPGKKKKEDEEKD